MVTSNTGYFTNTANEMNSDANLEVQDEGEQEKIVCVSFIKYLQSYL